MVWRDARGPGLERAGCRYVVPQGLPRVVAVGPWATSSQKTRKDARLAPEPLAEAPTTTPVRCPATCRVTCPATCNPCTHLPRITPPPILPCLPLSLSLSAPDAKPPPNMLFICKLNPVTSEEDLEIIFSRCGLGLGKKGCLHDCGLAKKVVDGRQSLVCARAQRESPRGRGQRRAEVVVVGCRHQRKLGGCRLVLEGRGDRANTPSLTMFPCSSHDYHAAHAQVRPRDLV